MGRGAEKDSYELRVTGYGACQHKALATLTILTALGHLDHLVTEF